MSDLDTYLTVREAARRFKVGKTTLYDLIDSRPELVRDGIVVKVPPPTGPWRVRARAFARWLDHGNGVAAQPFTTRDGGPAAP